MAVLSGALECFEMEETFRGRLVQAPAVRRDTQHLQLEQFTQSLVHPDLDYFSLQPLHLMGHGSSLFLCNRLKLDLGWGWGGGGDEAIKNFTLDTCGRKFWVLPNPNCTVKITRDGRERFLGGY